MVILEISSAILQPVTGTWLSATATYHKITSKAIISC